MTLAYEREDYQGFGEILAGLAAQADQIRHGRLHGELLVTPALYNAFPGNGVVQANPLGETLWRKILLVESAPTAKITLTVILPADGMLLG